MIATGLARRRGGSAAATWQRRRPNSTDSYATSAKSWIADGSDDAGEQAFVQMSRRWARYADRTPWAWLASPVSVPSATG